MHTQRETRRLRFESLEDRRLLAVYTVSSTANSGAGSLREAITQANATQVADEIVFAPELSGATIELSNSQLEIRSNLSIDATALPAGVTIDGNRSTRLFWIEQSLQLQVQLRGLTFTGSRGDGEGAIINYGTLVVNACKFVDNVDVPIWNSGIVTISHSFFYHNSGEGEDASAIYNQGRATITDSTFAENGRGTSQLYNPPVIHTTSGSNRSLTIERSTIGGDQVPSNFDGHGTSLYYLAVGSPVARVLIKDSVIVGHVHGPVQADYSLLADVDPSFVAGTGYLLNMDPQLGPLADNGGPMPTYAVLPSSPGLNAGNPSFAPTAGQTDQRGAPYQRLVGRLDMGAYEAQAVPAGTPGDFNADGRVDAADYSVWRDHLGLIVAPLTAGDATGDGLVDQGDYRTWRAHFGFVPLGGRLVVNSLGDRDDGNISNGILTLREAINFYRTVTWVDTITFDPSLSGGVIRVGTQGPGYYQIEKALTIDARSLPDGITIDGRGGTIGLHINAYTVPTPNDFDVTLAGLTIANGVGAFGGGGAINSLTTGKLTVIDCQLLNSNSGNYGVSGAIYALGNVDVIDTVIDGALALGGFSPLGGIGAAIFATGDINVVRSTIRNVGDATRRNVGILAGNNLNSALYRLVTMTDSEITTTSGGGIAVQGHAQLVRSRIESTAGIGILAPLLGNGSLNIASSVALVDSIVRNNTSTFGYNFQGKRAGSGIVAGGDVTLTRSRVENNRVTNVSDVVGGGIMAWGHVNATDSFINGNYAEAGGGIYARGIDAQGTPLPTEIVVTLLRTQVNQNESQFGGAAIQSSGSVAVDASSLSENRVRRESRSSATDSVVMLEGSSLWTLTITDSLLEKNSAPGLDVRVTSSLGNIRLIRSQVLDNEMQGITATRVIDSTISRNAGGVLGAVEIIGSTISDNRSVGVSGGSNVRIQDSTIRGNSYSTTFFGAPAAGVRSTGTVVVERSLIAENHSTFTLDGAGLQAAGGIRASTVVLVDSTVRDNTVTGPGAQGGGLSAQTLQAYGSTISGNSALGDGARGGGIFASQRVVLRQSTLSGNHVEGISAQGGGLWTPNLDALHATIFGNNALGDETTGGGVYTDSVSRFVGSVAAGNTAAAAPDFRAVAVDPTETAPGVAYSLIQNTEGSPLATGGGGVGNLFGLDPLLGPLANNGGRTLTHAPLSGSPLIDAGDPTITSVPFGLTTPFPPPINIAGIFDQRGEPFARVVDGGSGTLRIDIGAIEVQAAPSLPALDAAFALLP